MGLFKAAEGHLKLADVVRNSKRWIWSCSESVGWLSLKEQGWRGKEEGGRQSRIINFLGPSSSSNWHRNFMYCEIIVK